MKRTILTFGLAMAAGLLSAEVKVSAVGLQVTGKGYQVEGEDAHSGLRPFNWTEGTRVSLLFESDGNNIISLDEDAAKITLFSDDKETNFLEVESRFSGRAYNFEFMTISSDGKALITTLATEGLPKKGAGKIMVEGEVTVKTGSKSKVEKSKKVPVKKGAKVVIGEHTFEIEEFGKPKWGDYPFEIKLKSKVNHKDFKGFIFWDEKGKKVESKQNGSSSFGLFGKRTYTVNFQMKRKVKQLTLGLDSWTDAKNEKVPFKLELGAGL